ncbi:hypothetical protein DIU31_016705 [Mucilaginibacter rubeus]|uniref:Uncharacterized protein n=1 Tax=Mucilaginibacter rubeus TaxID=2027860 RepID=A0AAE6MJA3_9SPHI|nr:MULTISPECIES: hypothetical protein [Mucilaginibacter]QEM05074.1 hypothetical protein DIU31_016705 [Mucilaginibacter rubeus]QEM17667.1 hypothetical protein DIU38_016875 [Mucilaginibacter gossypii]QTE45808.1 hypothetical protein J3L19_10810 [Mucilaginibacter rubeus]QTE52405.1 hypothetical protein J3L21_10785 [Mucilaginibacter rubeus]QTE57494.1 hypothetical protein J3L23_02460 [Mucilaginibacter rubeus]
MKKFIALMLLGFHLLNIGGQLALHQFMVYKSNKYFAEQTAKGFYNVKDLTEIVIPVNMPGITDWKNYENIHGQIRFDNNSYNYQKMRVTSRAIYLMCIPNYETTRLADKNIINAKDIKENPVPQKEHVPFGKIIMQDNLNFTFVHFEFGCHIKYTQQIVAQIVQQLIPAHQDIPEQPPKAVC